MLRGDLLQHARYAGRPRLRIAITGARGLIGNALDSVPHHRRPRGDPSGPSRPQSRRRGAVVDGRRHHQSRDGLGRLDAVIHLAGESIASGRWTAARKERILRSRVDGTQRLAESLAKLPEPPAALLCASGDRLLRRAAGRCVRRGRAGEQGSSRRSVSNGRPPRRRPCAPAFASATCGMGIVLTPAGGALGTMLPIFKLGGGGRRRAPESSR